MLVQGVHLIDICRFFMGEVIQIQSMKNVSKKNRLSFVTNFMFKNRSIGSLSFSSSALKWSSYVEIISDNFSKISVLDGIKLEYENTNSWTKNFNFNNSVAKQIYGDGVSYNSESDI